MSKVTEIVNAIKLLNADEMRVLRSKLDITIFDESTCRAKEYLKSFVDEGWTVKMSTSTNGCQTWAYCYHPNHTNANRKPYARILVPESLSTTPSISIVHPNGQTVFQSKDYAAALATAKNFDSVYNNAIEALKDIGATNITINNQYNVVDAKCSGYSIRVDVESKRIKITFHRDDGIYYGAGVHSWDTGAKSMCILPIRDIKELGLCTVVNGKITMDTSNPNTAPWFLNSGSDRPFFIANEDEVIILDAEWVYEAQGHNGHYEYKPSNIRFKTPTELKKKISKLLSTMLGGKK